MISLRFLLYFLFFFALIESLAAQEERLEIKAAYTLDGWQPFGASSSDFGQQGNLDLTTDLLLGKLGDFRFHVLYNHGPSLSARLGDIQIANNYEATKGYKIYEFWYQKSWGKGSIKLGQLDVNNNFAFTDYGAFFIHSSFGIGPEFTLNIPLSTFPLTSLGFVGEYALNATFRLLLGLFDAYPGMDFSNAWSARLALDREEGSFFISELEWSKKGKHKLGYWRNASFGQLRTGYYLYGDFPLIMEDEEDRLGLFYQLGWVNQPYAVVRHYQGLGMVYKNPFAEGKDALGLAYARANFSALGRNSMVLNNAQAEQVFELNYTYKIASFLTLQPTWQLILHPALRSNTPSTSVFMLRFHFLKG